MMFEFNDYGAKREKHNHRKRVNSDSHPSAVPYDRQPPAKGQSICQGILGSAILPATKHNHHAPQVFNFFLQAVQPIAVCELPAVSKSWQGGNGQQLPGRIERYASDSWLAQNTQWMAATSFRTP
jgi:hypothetical protein